MDLEKELTCSICTDILYQPLTLLDCLHTFCGACLKEWFSWQALAAETSPNPPAAGAPIFTCPSCRDAVRSTRHNATVATLLDMLLTTQPDKRKPDNEKAEMDSKYHPGDNVLPKVRIPKRSAEQQRLDAAEQRLVDEVREISRREAVAAAESAEDSSGSAPSSAREARRRQRAAASRSSTGGSGADSPSEDTRRRRVANQSIPRIMGHQSSLRSLISNTQDISGSSNITLDIEQEIAAFARQIEEEGILDGLDLDNIDINNDDELNRRIAEAYERRQRGRLRHNNTGRNEGGRRDASRQDGSRHDGNTNNRHRASSAVSQRSQISGSGATPAAAAQPDRSPGCPTLSVSSATASRPPSSSVRPSSRHRRSHSQSSHRSQSSTGGAWLQSPAANDGAPSAAALSVPLASPAARPQTSTSSHHHLEVRDESRRHHQRRRTTSDGRSTGLLASNLDASAARPSAAHSQTDLPIRPIELPGSSVEPAELSSWPPPLFASRTTARQSEGRSASFPSPSPSSSSSSLQSNQNSLSTTATAASFQARKLAMGLSGLSNQNASVPVSRAPGSPTANNGGQSRVKRGPAAAPGSINAEPLPMVAAHLAMSPVAAETHELPTLVSPTAYSFQQQQQQLNRHHRQASIAFTEPDIHCSRCARKHIQYEVHYNCGTCSNGNWNICIGCYRAGKGCQHWFGFGYSGQSKWEKRAAQWRSENPAAAANGVPFPPPHILTTNRYLAPRNAPAEIDRTTTEDPQARLQSGVFCAGCQAWANSCFWRCDVCNEGDWGFCNDCVNQGFSCTHPLLPLTYLPAQQDAAPPPSSQPPYDSQHPHLPSPPPRPQASAIFQTPGTPLDAPSASASRMGPFRPLAFTTTCDLCQKAIPPHSLRFHCYSCKSNVVPGTLPGDYDICQGCYDSLVVAQPPSPDGPSTRNRPAMAPENGPNGWRRCPTGGHRMVVVAFFEDKKGGVPRRVVLEDLVGGSRLETEKVPPTTAAAIEAKKRGIDLESWYVWYAEKRMFEHYVSHDVRMSAGILGSSSKSAGPVMSASAAAAAVVNQPFPPLGGVGYTATARWAYYPEPSSDDGATADDELLFPRHAEIREIEDVNGEWFHGVYMGRKGLFPSGFVRLAQHARSK